MIELTKISLSDKNLFDTYFKKYNPQISELNFSTLFTWSDSYNYHYAKINEYLVVVSISNSFHPFAYFPIGTVEEESFYDLIVQLKKFFEDKGWEFIIHSMTHAQSQLLKEIWIRKHSENSITIELDRDDSDYVYLTSDLIYLKGKKYDAKRNHINRFQNNNSYEYYDLTPNFKSACVNIIEKWCQTMKCISDESLSQEKLANSLLIENLEALGCTGCIIKVNGNFEAFSVGEMLNEDTAVIHLEKASTKIDGLYQFINQQFCANHWKNTKYINREQDLGLEGLRKSKLSYHPAHILEKYVAFFR